MLHFGALASFLIENGAKTIENGAETIGNGAVTIENGVVFDRLGGTPEHTIRIIVRD